MQRPDRDNGPVRMLPGSQRRPLDRRALARHLNLWENELDALIDNHRHRLITRIARLLSKERQRGIDGHWAYDLARHRLLRDSLDQLRAV